MDHQNASIRQALGSAACVRFRRKPQRPGGVWPCHIHVGNIAIEHGHLWLIYPLNIAIFHSYVNLPEGNMWEKQCHVYHP